MHADLETLDRELAASVANLDSRQTQAAPTHEVGKWNIQEIVDHLLATYAATEPALRTRIEKGTPTRATPSIPQRLGVFYITALGLFPRGRKAPAAVAPARPAPVRSGAELAERVHRDIEHLDGTIAEAELLFGSRRAASHLILGPLSMPQWARFHLVHGRHHIKQIRAIRKEHGF